MEKRPSKEQMATFKKNANDMSLSAEVRAKFQAIVDKFENVGEAVVDAVEGKKERKPRTPKATMERKPRATRQTADDVAMAKAEIKKRTGKTEEECEKIVEEYRSLRNKSQERKKKETKASKTNVARINKLKDDNKVIEGTNEKTADAVIESTTKDVAEKIEKQIEVIEKKAETEAKREVEKEMPKVSVTEKKQAVKEKVEEKVKEKTKTIVKRVVIDTSALLTSIAESLGKFDKDSQKEFLIKLRSDIDKLISKYSFGGMTDGATQIMNIQQSNLSSSSVNPTMFGNGGGVDNKKRFLVDFYDSSDTNRDTSIEISIRANTLEDAIEDAIKKANEFQKNYIEFYHRNMFLGSINFAVSKEFRQGKGYNDFVNNRFDNGGGVEGITPELNRSVKERAEEIYRNNKGKTKKDFDNAFNKAIREFGYSPQIYHQTMREIGREYDESDEFGNGGGVDSKAEKLANTIRKDYQNSVVVQVYNDYGDSAYFSISAPFEYSLSKERAKEINKKYFNGKGEISGGGNEHYLNVNFDLDNFANGGGIKDVIVYDNGGESLDRYTIFTPDGSVYGMSESGGGFNQYLGDDTEVEKGSHLGKRLKSVPKSIEKAVMQRMNDSYAKGGMTEHGLRIGDSIIEDFDDESVGVKSSNGDFHYVNLDKGQRFNNGGGVGGRQKDTYNKLVASRDNEFYFVDYIFNDADGFKGATGTIVTPVSKEYYEYATSEQGILERYMDAMGEDEWLNALGLDRDDFEDEDEMIKAIEDGIYELYRVGELNPFEEVNYDLEEQMRKLPEFSDSDEFPLFEINGFGRVFGKDTKFDKIYDQELYNKIRKVEEFKRGGNVNTGRSCKLDRAKQNKNEKYELPLSSRKKAHGGTIEERMRMRRGM